jgi:hypothetical protein
MLQQKQRQKKTQVKEIGEGTKAATNFSTEILTDRAARLD